MSVFIKGLNRFIKGMKMPKLEKTYKVRLYKAVDGRIIVTACGVKENVFQVVGEAIEVSTPHGELVDRNELMDTYADRLTAVAERYFPDSSECGILSGAMKLLAIMPTVIEAEGTE